jgi:hypothetical protein
MFTDCHFFGDSDFSEEVRVIRIVPPRGEFRGGPQAPSVSQTIAIIRAGCGLLSFPEIHAVSLMNFREFPRFSGF